MRHWLFLFCRWRAERLHAKAGRFADLSDAWADRALRFKDAAMKTKET